MTDFNKRINQERTAGHLAIVQILKNDTLGAFLRAFRPQRCKISLLSLQSKFTPIERTRRAYINAVTVHTKQQNNNFRPSKHHQPKPGHKNHINFMALNTRFMA